ncbi:MAG: excinuclease ABC subunit UvrC [Micavibrio sp.]|nr:excinuclease ABC subunit UvrC [Micavibrio sp.]
MKDDIGMSVIESGASAIRGYVKKLPDTPGVYRMMDEHGGVLYVGKAKSLKKRVSNYTLPDKLPIRLQRMIAATVKMEFIHTQTEAEALLLESNLIKKLKPRYNILLRDDKSFPYILITDDHDYPQVVKHRGAKKGRGQYYGPFASAGDVNRTIAILQRLFMLRNCTDSYFAQRSRPCLQYHIKRCTAPCVGYVSKDGYGEQIAQAQDFMAGRSVDIQARFARDMEAAAADMDYESAAQFRDKIRTLSAIQAKQDINVEGIKDADVFALVSREGVTCIQAFFFRGGRNYGNRSYFPRHMADDAIEDVISAFMAQFYTTRAAPVTVLVNVMPRDKGLLQEALSTSYKVSISVPQRGGRRRVTEFSERNARAALATHMANKSNEKTMLEAVAELFDLEEAPQRIEVYDNSHISGTNMVGAMIVSGEEGFIKNAYRKFNIREAAESDDFGMMREVMARRFRKFADADSEQDEPLPDLLLIDGGLGQFNAVKEVLEDMGLWSVLNVVAISKGPDRNAGREQFHMEGRASFQLPVNTPVLHYLQRLRDEAHRFAIGAHRARRSKDIVSSPLDEVAGIGAKRKKALLAYFGSAKAVAGAGIEDLEKVDGISRAVAQTIYDHFH